MAEIHITEDHIYHARWATDYAPDDPRKDAVFAAFQDAGIEVEFEIYLNHLPPRHDWAILIIERESFIEDSRFGPVGCVRTIRKRYAMTPALLRYYDYLRIEQGHRTKPAVINLDDEAMTADVREKRYVSYARQLGYRRISLGGHWE